MKRNGENHMKQNSSAQRAGALSLAALMLLSLLASCGSAPAGTVDTTAAPDETSADAETGPAIEVPDTKYDGFTFRILGDKIKEGVLNSEIDADEETGDALNDAVYMRNRLTEDKFGIEIVHVESSGVAADIGKSVLAGEDAYDCALNMISGCFAMMGSGYLTELDKLTYVDIDKPWWSTESIKSSAIAGKRFMLFGDYGWSDKNCTWALCFNKDLYNEYKLTEPYQMVRDGKWTMDVLEEHCKNITQDVNGDSVLDYHDQWGLLSSNTASIGFVTSCGIQTAKSTDDGFVYDLTSEKNVTALSKIYKFFSNGDLQLRAEAITGVSNIWTEIINVFREGRALYRISIMSNIADLRDMEDDFGILPMPKYDENQSQYYTTMQAWTGKALVVPLTASNLDRTSAILEYMCGVSPDTVRKAYYDVTLQGKVARDTNSVEMLDLIFSTVVTDVALAYETDNIKATLVNIMKADSDTVSSTLASSKAGIESALQTLYDNISALK